MTKLMINYMIYLVVLLNKYYDLKENLEINKLNLYFIKNINLKNNYTSGEK